MVKKGKWLCPKIVLSVAPRSQGKRNDMAVVKKMIDENPRVSRKELEDECFGLMMRYPRILDYKRRQQEPRRKKSICFLFVGPPGTGKSTLMKILAKLLGTVYHVPMKKGSGQYFDDYDGENVMVLDEFDGDRMKPTDFNSLVDEHPHVLPVHGGAGHQMVSEYVFIGSNYHPAYWWRKRKPVQLQQTMRRIDVIFKVGMDREQPVLANWLMLGNGGLVGSVSKNLK